MEQLRQYISLNSLALVFFLVILLGMVIQTLITRHIRKSYPRVWLSFQFPSTSPFSLATAKSESDSVAAVMRFVAFLRSNERKYLQDTFLDRLVHAFGFLMLLGAFTLALCILALLPA